MSKKCQYCGRRSRSVSMHSGILECDRCWDWRKLDHNAALFWKKGIDTLFQNEFGTGPDFNDWRKWDQWGMKEEVTRALYTLMALGHAYDEMLNNPRPWKVDNEGATSSSSRSEAVQGV